MIAVCVMFPCVPINLGSELRSGVLAGCALAACFSGAFRRAISPLRPSGRSSDVAGLDAFWSAGFSPFCHQPPGLLVAGSSGELYSSRCVMVYAGDTVFFSAAVSRLPCVGFQVVSDVSIGTLCYPRMAIALIVPPLPLCRLAAATAVLCPSTLYVLHRRTTNPMQCVRLVQSAVAHRLTHFNRELLCPWRVFWSLW